LKDEGVEILIALGHSGYELDMKMAKEIEEIDVVVGGHSHTFLWTGKCEY
jgi:2',3'-cyclic-nucleotide 2'-phosphodiesterase (5'-nucleotidase family)